jgi:hypothetical protein
VSLEEERLREINQQLPQLMAKAGFIVREIEQEELLQPQDAAADIVDNMWKKGMMREHQELAEHAVPVVQARTPTRTAMLGDCHEQMHRCQAENRDREAGQVMPKLDWELNWKSRLFDQP